MRTVRGGTKATTFSGSLQDGRVRDPTGSQINCFVSMFASARFGSTSSGRALLSVSQFYGRGNEVRVVYLTTRWMMRHTVSANEREMFATAHWHSPFELGVWINTTTLENALFNLNREHAHQAMSTNVQIRGEFRTETEIVFVCQSLGGNEKVLPILSTAKSHGGLSGSWNPHFIRRETADLGHFFRASKYWYSEPLKFDGAGSPLRRALSIDKL